MSISLLAHRGTQGERDAGLTGKVLPFEGMGVWRVPARDSLDGGFEIPEAFLLDARGELRAEAAETRGLVRDHAAAGLLDRAADRLEIERRDRAHVDDLGIDAELARR